MDEKLKIVALIVLFPLLIAFSFWADYKYKTWIVKSAMEQTQTEQIKGE